MQISLKEIIFAKNQNKRDILLTNNTQSFIIFKVRTNDVVRFKANPGRGYLTQKQTLPIEIVYTANQLIFQAKLQINWAQVQQKSQNFDQGWKKVNPNTFKSDIIPICRKQNLSQIKEQKNENSTNKNYEMGQEEDCLQLNDSSSMSDFSHTFNQKSSKNTNKIIQTKINNQQIIKSNSNSNSNQLKRMYSIKEPQKKQPQKKSLKIPQKKQIRMIQTKIVKQEKNYGNNPYQPSNAQSRIPNPYLNNQSYPSQAGIRVNSQPAFLQSSLGPNQLSHLCFVQSQLLAQRQQHQRLKQQIRKNKQLQNQRNQMMRQYNVNRSMTQQCDHDNVNWPVLLFFAAIFFIIGVLISRF